MPFAQFATDPKHVFDVMNECKIDPEQLKEWQRDRQGCVVDRKLAEKRNWKIGDRVPLQGTFYPVDLDLKIVGCMTRRSTATRFGSIGRISTKS